MDIGKIKKNTPKRPRTSEVWSKNGIGRDGQANSFVRMEGPLAKETRLGGPSTPETQRNGVP